MAGAPRAALRFGFCGFISITRTIARGVTDMDVGSGVLFGKELANRGSRVERMLSRPNTQRSTRYLAEAVDANL